MALAVAHALMASAAGAGGGRSPGAEWAKGPQLWLLQRWERRQLKKVRSQEELEAFVQAFWWRRDPSLDEPGNAFADLFLKRVEEADLLFQEEGARGSLCDRGGALLLLGPPAAMHRGPRSALSVAFTHDQEGHHRPLSQETIEVWRYRVHELPLPIQEALEGRTEVELTFRVDELDVVLLDGKWALEAAARATILRGRD